jgi:hypothetical protein
MKLLEFNILKPAQNYPQHVIVRLHPQAEGILAEVEG